ncbi:hypothetical protein [Mycoplasma sp. P36-A1]|uniref:hypothetical protein n=1 Tax=Mycoplasma sp. P36-A1 TaxID=3252900 RepID=UPI003C2D230B
MKKNIILIFILCLSILIKQFDNNYADIQNIGKENNEYVSVLLKRGNSLSNLINYAEKNSLNISYLSIENNETVIYQIKNYDPYTTTKNKYDKGLNDFENKVNFFQSNVRTEQLNKDHIVNGFRSYSITSKDKDYDVLKKSLDEVGFEAYLVHVVKSNDIDFIFDVILILVISILLLSFIIEYNKQKKKINIELTPVK